MVESTTLPFKFAIRLHGNIITIPFKTPVEDNVSFIYVGCIINSEVTRIDII
jgi:hypothetical protein